MKRRKKKIKMKVVKPRPEKLKISFCMPVYNKVDYIADAIESYLEQTYKNKELIIVDDNSNDKVEQLLAYYEGLARGSGIAIHVIRNSKNQGVANCRNQAWEAASGDIICVMDADDMSEITRAEYTARYFEDNPKVDIAYGLCAVTSAIGQVLGTNELKPFSICDLKENNYISHPTVAYRRNLDVRYRKDLRFIDDWYFYMDCVAKGYNFGVINQLLAVYRPLPTGLTLEGDFYAKEKEKAKAKLRDEFKDFDNDLSEELVKKGSWQEIRVKSILKEIPKGSKVLDIGCNGGKLMELMAKKGCKCVGIEKAPNLANICHKKGLEVMPLDALSMPVSNVLRDRIILGDILEHYQKDEVSKLLQTCYDSLKPDGKVIITVPYKHAPYNAANVSDHVRDYELKDFEDLFPRLKYKLKLIMSEHAVPIWLLVIGSK